MLILNDLLSKKIPDISPSKAADQFTEAEHDHLIRQETIRQKELETQDKKLELQQKKEEHNQRVDYAKKIFILISVWLLVILFIVIASASHCTYFTLDISDSVLITLLTTTTITVLGLFITVINYIFSRKN